MISTRFTRMLDIRHPVALAGMGGVGRAELAAAVSNAGGLGILGMIRMPPDYIREQIRRTRALTKQPFGVNLVPPCAPAPGGVDAQLQVCFEERVPVLSLFWCDAAPYMERCRAAGVAVILQVGSSDEARAAANAGVDVIVAQGTEAGGHVRGQLGLHALLPAVVDAVAPVPVLAAGGIVNGRGLAAAISLGADGAWVGTRFVASEESEAHPDYKKRLLQATGADTVISKTPRVEWPPEAAYRLLRNALTDGAPPPSKPIARVRRGDNFVELPVFTSAPPTVHTEGRTDLMANYASQSVGLIREILPAAAIVERMVSEAEDTIRRLPALLT
jgi:NAD(P)H-dependent flavin oxidoreductase YrpB (nitropropane dioxygenase family)